MSIYMVFAGFLILLLMAGLLIDGGSALIAQERVLNVADQAARAGAAQVSAESLRTGNPSLLQIDPNAARTEGQQILSAAGATGTIKVTGPGEVTATANLTKRTVILSVINIDHISATGSATAITLHGTTTGSP
jgi:Flp pilus assembly protein TadG